MRLWLCLVVLMVCYTSARPMRKKRQIYRGLLDSIRAEELPLYLLAGSQFAAQMGRLNANVPGDPYTPAYRVDKMDTFRTNWYWEFPIWRIRPQVGNGDVNQELFLNNVAAGNVPNAPSYLVPGFAAHAGEPVKPRFTASKDGGGGLFGKLPLGRKKRQAASTTEYNLQCLRHFRGPFFHPQYVNGVFVDACNQPIPSEYILGARVDQDSQDVFGPLVQQQAGFDYLGNPIPQPERKPRLLKTKPSDGRKNTANPFDLIPTRQFPSSVDNTRPVPGINAQSITTLLNALAPVGTDPLAALKQGGGLKIPGIGNLG